MKALLLVWSSPGRADEVQSKIKAVKGVNEALVVTGRADVAVFVEGSLDEINRSVKSIWGVDGVTTTETLLEVS